MRGINIRLEPGRGFLQHVSESGRGVHTLKKTIILYCIFYDTVERKRRKEKTCSITEQLSVAGELLA